ncbi:MAG: hypothetical protein V2J62_10960 [candidate division KSB1 bacterium]|jgi:hypothetical protein|nr:hypothetical protein [candidate division KSB1 bacterium]
MIKQQRNSSSEFAGVRSDGSEPLFIFDKGTQELWSELNRELKQIELENKENQRLSQLLARKISGLVEETIAENDI